PLELLGPGQSRSRFLTRRESWPAWGQCAGRGGRSSLVFASRRGWSGAGHGGRQGVRRVRRAGLVARTGFHGRRLGVPAQRDRRRHAVVSRKHREWIESPAQPLDLSANGGGLRFW